MIHLSDLGKELGRSKIVYRPTERALVGDVVVAPIESPNHLKITLDSGDVRYIEMSCIVSINGERKK